MPTHFNLGMQISHSIIALKHREILGSMYLGQKGDYSVNHGEINAIESELKLFIDYSRNNPPLIHEEIIQINGKSQSFLHIKRKGKLWSLWFRN